MEGGLTALCPCAEEARLEAASGPCLPGGPECVGSLGHLEEKSVSQSEFSYCTCEDEPGYFHILDSFIDF